MNNNAPYEVISGPFTLWLAPVGTAFPLVDEEPGGSWFKVGSGGADNYDEGGVKVSHKDKVEFWKALGSTGPRKAFRSEEEQTISMVLVDLTLEQYALALNHNSVTTVAPGVNGGYKKVGLSRGINVQERALLVRGGISPYGVGTVQDWAMQFEVPRVVQTGDPSPIFVKGKPAMLQLEYTALEDTDAASDDERFGRLIAQNADHT